VQQGDGEQLRSMDERPAVCLRNHQVTILMGNMVKDRTKPFHLANLGFMEHLEYLYS
jgi:hypothetical protein